MKKILIFLSFVFIVLLSVFAFTIINTKAKVEDGKVYNTIQKEKYNDKKELVETKEEQEQLEQEEKAEEQETDI